MVLSQEDNPGERCGVNWLCQFQMLQYPQGTNGLQFRRASAAGLVNDC
ncbi:MAG TPA: hypothetical protein VGF67_23605 [Ktedonobacteraceae bacterium]